MSHSPDPRHTIRRVQLPSGRCIEVVHFPDAAPVPELACGPELPAAPEPAAATASTAPARPAGGALHVCGACGSELVHPTSWDTAADGAWRLDLRCPNCESTTTGVFAGEAVEAFDEWLECAGQDLAGDLRELTRANMEVEVDRFVAALQADLIWPIDF